MMFDRRERAQRWLMATIVTGGLLWVGAAEAAAPETQPAIGPEHMCGVITAEQTRPMKPCQDPKLAALLKSYEEPAGDVAWTMDKLSAEPTYDIYDLRFPSPVVTGTTENNTVYCEYYHCRGEQKRPAVVVLHISDGRFRESRLICSFLAVHGMDGLLLKMAYYGPRRPKDTSRLANFMNDLDAMVAAIRQSVMDARRAARWMQYQPHVDATRVSLLGTSLGGFVGSVASGVDGKFYRSVIILAGGRLEEVLMGPSKEVRAGREAFKASGITSEELLRKLKPIEPCTFAARIDPRSVLMVNTRNDPVVPPANAEALAQAIGGVKIQWYEGDHYALLWKLWEVFGQVGKHLSGDMPSSAPSR